jgi:hypothetical protein
VNFHIKLAQTIHSLDVTRSNVVRRRRNTNDRQNAGKKGRKEVVAELVPGGEKDSVVYLGKSSFKMKVGVRMTPPAGTTPTVPPSPLRGLQTPRPRLRTPPRNPSAQSGSHSRPPVAPEGAMVQGVALAKSTLVGLCLTAFSCGIMCTVAVDRYWPRARTECVGAQPGATTRAAAPVEPVIEPPAQPAPAKAASVAEVVSLPPYGEKLPTADKVVAVEAAAAAPAAVAVAPAPAPSMPPAVAPRARPVASPAPAPRTAAPARLGPAQGRTVVRKRPGPAAVAADQSSAAPTETWTDPFAE